MLLIWNLSHTHTNTHELAAVRSAEKSNWLCNVWLYLCVHVRLCLLCKIDVKSMSYTGFKRRHTFRVVFHFVPFSNILILKHLMIVSVWSYFHFVHETKIEKKTKRHYALQFANHSVSLANNQHNKTHANLIEIQVSFSLFYFLHLFCLNKQCTILRQFILSSNSVWFVHVCVCVCVRQNIYAAVKIDDNIMLIQKIKTHLR